jgi:hypothetical protein
MNISKMGLKVRYFMPPNSVAPLAFYFSGDLLSDYTNLELISTLVRWKASKRFIVLRFTTQTLRQERLINRV